MKNINKTIRELDALEAVCCMKAHEQGEKGYPWGGFCETLKTAASALKEMEKHGLNKWNLVENGLPDENIDVQVTVQNMEFGGGVYRDVDCVIDNGDGPLWAEHHGAWDRVLAWAPMLPAYQPGGGGKE